MNLHLAGMNLRDEWQRLEKRIQSQTASAPGSDTAEDAVQALKREIMRSSSAFTTMEPRASWPYEERD